ncbi:DUF6332 family protein [Streptomyces sp. SYSU K21746]
MGKRTQAERDAITVEIGYALFSAVFAAALVCGALAGPALLFALPRLVERGLVLAGGTAAALVFVLRVVHVLWRYASGRPAAGQPGVVVSSAPCRVDPRRGPVGPRRGRRTPRAPRRCG